MTTPPTPSAPGRPEAGEISALIAWMRRISDTGIRHIDPAELAAFHHAKHELLARIEHHNPGPHPQPGDQR